MSERDLREDLVEELTEVVGELGEALVEDYLIVFEDDLYPQSCAIR